MCMWDGYEDSPSVYCGHGESVMDLLEAYEREGLEPPRQWRRRPEHALQKELKGLVREYVAIPHKFAAHDRTKKTNDTQHILEAARGIVSGWPDTELCLLGGDTFRCELKARGKQVKKCSNQDRVINELNRLGHRTYVADCAVAYVKAAIASGIVPFRPGAMRRAEAIDQFLAEAARQHALGKPRRPARARQGKATGRALRVAATFYKP